MYNKHMENWKKKKWAIGVSGGADSMALLDMCRRDNVDIVVCHVNYKKRDTADRDMRGVRLYCQKFHIPFYVEKVNAYTTDNFQSQAREIRYKFFSKIVKDENCVGVLSAHQEDDVLETYIFQKNSGRVPNHYGIKEESIWEDILVYRPLLHYTKNELLEYCENNNVPHFMDESNLTDYYERNRIRHHIVEKMNEEERTRMLEEIKNINEVLYSLRNEAKAYIQDVLDLETVLSLRDILMRMVLRLYVLEKGLFRISEQNLAEFIHQITTTDKNFIHELNQTHSLICEYGKIYIIENDIPDYSYAYNSIVYIKEENFMLTNEGLKIEGLYVKESDFPIIVRNARENDAIQLRFGNKKINRFFIDRKISYKDRKTWPVIENNKGEIIFVKGLGCAVDSYNEGNYNLYLK